MRKNTIRIVKRSREREAERVKNTERTNGYKSYVMAIIDNYNKPKGKSVRHFGKEFKKISKIMCQSEKRYRVSDGYMTLHDFLFNDELSIIKYVYVGDKILLFYNSEYGKYQRRISKIVIKDLLLPVLHIMKKQNKIKNFIYV